MPNAHAGIDAPCKPSGYFPFTCYIPVCLINILSKSGISLEIVSNSQAGKLLAQALRECTHA